MVTFLTFQTGEIWLYINRKKAQHELRIQVTDFINRKIGAEHVISITEVLAGFNLYITVWFRTEQSSAQISQHIQGNVTGGEYPQYSGRLPPR